MDSKITFLVFTFNEERRLEHYLKCIQGWGQIVIIDNLSTDKTREIATNYTEHIYTFPNPGYVENKETMDFVLSKVTTKWAYLSYVDELLPESLLEQLAQITQEDRYKIVEIYRKNFMYGQEVFNYGKHHLRMFVPGSVDFTDNIVHRLGKFLVHSHQIYKIPVSDQTSLWHFSSYNTCKLELAHNRYAELEAKQRHEMLKQKFSGIHALWKLVFYFWGTYLGLGGFRGGWPGLFISIQIAYFKFSIEARLWEYDNDLTLAEIERRYDCLKEELLTHRTIEKA
jgi:glycosyltransferase involved in cell wall biosynthesis